MRSAAVGFQCPNCVSEGARQTRSGRTAYGGQRSGNPALTSQVLIGINVVIWAATFLSGRYSSRLFDALALTPRGTDADPGVADGAYWQLVTSMFVHVQIWHIAVNMLALWFLGPQLEVTIGRVRFLLLYFLSGLGGSALVYWFAPEYSATHGASGAVFGLMAALLVVAVKVRGNVQEILYWIGLNAVITLLFIGRISWQGHLGGFVAGAVLMGVLVYAPRSRRTAWQAAGFTLVGLVIAAAIVARSLALG